MKGMKFNRTMLEYCKIILTKMNFDRKLFRKEYRKSFRYLDPDDHQELKKWLRSKLGTDNRLRLS
jgi:hypothetical protein